MRSLKKTNVYIGSDFVCLAVEMTLVSILRWLFRFHKIFGWECIYKKRNVSRAKMTFDDPKKSLDILAKVLFYFLSLCRISLFISTSSRQVFPTKSIYQIWQNSYNIYNWINNSSKHFVFYLQFLCYLRWNLSLTFICNLIIPFDFCLVFKIKRLKE